MDQSNPKNYLQAENQYFSSINQYFDECSGSYTEKVHAFSRFVPRQAISYFLARNDIFKEVINLHGNILDFGIFKGSSFFSWLQFSATYEPYNHMRKVIGFDSFTGFSELTSDDMGTDGQDLHIKQAGGMAFTNGLEEMLKGIQLYNMNRPLGHVDKAEIVEGLLPTSLKGYLDSHPETIIAMANFGLGLYEPTVEILKLIKPRLQKGSILVFEDLNQATWPGETKALYDVFEPKEISLKRTPFCPHISWMKIED
ncbi:hypothetical protein [uncultured Paraglaciecola sp.]|uniref:hypothetical protein n=1 Tax=uncultured Paraglaciecola sp. TaxID=1765024 RepID=UPI002617F754|nr:hypothetical protein [uncultured Paraglaciecola sp.]